MRRIIILLSVVLLSLSNQDLHPQIIGFYPPADTIGIGFGCTPPIIFCSVSSMPFAIDSIAIDPGWNTMMAFQDSMGNWEVIDNSYFLVEDSLDQYQYEIWYHPRSQPTPSILVPFDSSFECHHQFFDLQLMVKQQNIAIDSLSLLFRAQVGLGVEQQQTTLLLSQQVRLSQNYPNPFNPVTNINFFLPKASSVKIEIFDLMGKKMGTLLNSKKPAGFYTIEFDGSGLASGIYFYRIQAGQFVDVKKMVLMR